MKTVYIGDIHGRSVWKEIVTKHSDADVFVFIGDYFDSFDISPLLQLSNVNEIVKFKVDYEKDPNKKVYLLIGNHDIHYWPGVKTGGSTSGYQPTMAFQYQSFFLENEKHFQMAVCVGNKLCTHAGVSMEFLKNTCYIEDYSADLLVEHLNDMFHYKPYVYTFDSCVKNNEWYVNSYGDNTWQSPIWIRPKSLMQSNKKTELKKNFVQIVGHTQQDTIDIKGKSTGGKYYFIDALPNGEYLVEVDGKFVVDYCTIEHYI